MVRSYGILCKVVSQTVLIYGKESWVVAGAMMKVLEGFHHCAGRRIAGMTDQCMEDIELEYPPVADAM